MNAPDEETQLLERLKSMQPYEKLEWIALDMRQAELCARQGMPCRAERVRVWVGTLQAMSEGLAAPLNRGNRAARRATLSRARGH